MFLCIDTTSVYSSITLIDTSEEGRYLHIPLDSKNVSEQIIGKIEQIITKANIQLSDLEGVFVIRGPGSYTGLRVGVAVANQFAHQLKIPIIGITTDKWWQNFTDEEFLYIQSMNKEEVYIPGKIISLEELINSHKKEVKWLGKLSEDHTRKLPDNFIQLTEFRSPEETWIKLIKETKLESHKKYDLIEPYYGKEPTITKSNKRLSI